MPKKAKRGVGGKRGAKKVEQTPHEKEQILKDKLQKADRNTTLNLLKLNEGWRSVLRQSRASELRKDIDILKQTFERQLEDKDNVIECLQSDLKGAEHQWAEACRVHLQKIEHLRALQEKQLMLLKQQWEDGLQRSNSSFKSERKQMLGHSKMKRADLEDAKRTVEQQHQEVINEIHRLYIESIASSESDHVDRKAALVLEGMMAVCEKTRRRKDILELQQKVAKELDRLVLRTQKCIQTSEKTKRRVQKLQEFVIQLRMKLHSNKTEKVYVERDLPAARNKEKEITYTLRDQLTRSQLVARKQLIELTVQSDNATKKLKAIIANGERVLRVAELCQKLEGGQKNVFMSPSSAEDRHGSMTEEEEAKESSEFPELWLVMRHIYATLVHRDVLKKCNDDLSRENQQLRLLLGQHTGAMTVRDHALGGHHILLTVQKAPNFMALSGTARRQTVIDIRLSRRQTNTATGSGSDMVKSTMSLNSC
ncbi:dynein regulatory complex subunit 2-like [Platichthys flesus]|uniref:dynein regulatory complex subunit 2-like n=1 Tax=Platichthys flesus TaxID=8260 RepID=UPI002DB9AE31|nr:dynein regulatory complex subunit 2-like [Platichthys flesus]